MIRNYLSRIIGDGTEENPYRPKITEYPNQQWQANYLNPQGDIAYIDTDITDETVVLIESDADIFAIGGIEGLRRVMEAGGGQVSSGIITAAQYGLLGNGTDETAKVAKMVNALPPNGGKLIFDRGQQVTIDGTSIINIVDRKNVVIEGLNAIGGSKAVFQIRGGSKNIVFRDCVFENLSQVVYLFDCEQILIDACKFYHTGYGIIQRHGFASNNVKVINCTAENMQADFVECNCATVKSKNWIIANNHYLGSSAFPTYKTESRFVGITKVENVIVSHNIVENVSGDSAIHLEDVGGHIIIDHNIIDNVAFNEVLASYIWIINSGKIGVIVDNNIFLRSNPDIGKGSVVNVSNVYDNHVRYTNNIFKGTNHNLDGLNLSYRKNQFVMGNTFEDCDRAIITSNSGMPYVLEHNYFMNNNFDTVKID